MCSVECVTLVVALGAFGAIFSSADDGSGVSNRTVVNVSDCGANCCDGKFVEKSLVGDAREGFGDGHQGHGGTKIKKKGGGDLMSKILPFMVIPFMISSTMLPLVLLGLKFMLLKSAFVGKMAIILMLVNMFWRSNNQGGVYSHNINLNTPLEKEAAMAHYGYDGGEEYGAYVNRKRRR